MAGLIREEKALCGSNLAACGQNTRIRKGILGLAISLGLTIFLVQTGAARVWRLLLFLPFMLTAMGAVQGLYRTCPFHVRARTRVNEVGDTEPVMSPDEVKRARSLAGRVLATSCASALAATTLVFLLP